MKISKEHYEYLESAILPLMEEIPLSLYVEKGLSEKRYRWDLSYMANLTNWICDNIYPYADDSHLDTALRKITGTK